MYVLRHVPTGKWIQPKGSSQQLGEHPKAYTSYAMIRGAINSYLTDNLWRKKSEYITDEQIINELEVCDAEIVVRSAVPAAKVLAMLTEAEKQRKERLGIKKHNSL